MSAAIRSAAPRQSVRGVLDPHPAPHPYRSCTSQEPEELTAADEQLLRELIEWVNRRLLDRVIRGKP